MGILSFLFEPLVFYVLLAALVFGAVYIIFSALGRDSDEQPANQKQALDTQFLQIDTQKTEQESAQIKKALSSKEEELGILSREKDKQLKENERLKVSVNTLEKQLKAKEEVLKKENLSYQELQNKIKTLENEAADLKTDLSLKNQMYNGLKSQYEELEQSLIRGQAAKQETPPKSQGKEKDLLSRIENPQEKEG